MSECSKVFDYIQQRMIQGGIISTGCNDEEIAALETQYGIRFPAMYRIFLARMGHFARDFLVGTDWPYRYLSHLRRSAESLIAESGTSYRLPTDAFVFCMHQGYSFLFFQTAGDDPAVWLYVENDKAPKQVTPSFSSWLLDTVEAEIYWKSQRGGVGSPNAQ
jgi:hypothetical protein